MAGPRAAASLDGEWSFVRDPGARLDVSQLPPGEPIVVPGCWEAQVDGPYGIVTAWYRRSFVVPDGWRGSRVVIRFGAVMYTCDVYVNGQLAGSHEGGYTPFEFEVSPFLRIDGPNELAVRVINPANVIEDYPVFPEGDLSALERVAAERSGGLAAPLGEIPLGKQTWYSSQSGLWRSISLERRPAVGLRPLRVRPDVADSRALVRWGIDAAQDVPTDLSLAVEVADPDGLVVAFQSEAAEGADGEMPLSLESPRLWDIGKPDLYTVSAKLLAGDGTTLDEVVVRFGMREIRTDGGRILLNGRPVYFLGVLDQDLYPDSISGPPTRDLIDVQMRRTREMGLNLLRCHIKVPDPLYLDAADEAGILVWCELPNWLRFSGRAAERGRATLRAMVEELDNHPSIVIWTIINEDWGTRVREESRDRLWLRDSYEWLKELDPTRLIVDNSACDTAAMPNFHLRSDLADFHVYALAPDHAAWWRARIEDFARRPGWLWSPHGDAQPNGEEPLVLSEFGSWGLPRPDAGSPGDGEDPWWHRTGRGHFRPEGWEVRFGEYGLDRVWPSAMALAEATQWHQFEAMQDQIGELRSHESIQGYALTELCDANWEANGLLDGRRGPKVFHDRLADLHAPDVVVLDLPRRDLWSGERITVPVTFASYGAPATTGTMRWWLESNGQLEAGSASDGISIEGWPDAGAKTLRPLEVAMPLVDGPSDMVLHATVSDGTGRQRAHNAYRLAVLPMEVPQAEALGVAVQDLARLHRLGKRVAATGHRVVGGDDPDVVVTSELGPELLAPIEGGGRALVLARSRDAIAHGLVLARPLGIHPRRFRHPDWPGDRSPWEGDWVTSWSWIRHDLLPGLPMRNPLDFAYREILPDHVLTGYEPRRHGDEVCAGIFSGWIHAPAALAWRFPQGRGWLTITTLRVAPESGPTATVVLDRLIKLAAGRLGHDQEKRAAAGLEVA